MNNKKKYDRVFTKSFSISKGALGADLSYNTIPEWDSIGTYGIDCRIGGHSWH